MPSGRLWRAYAAGALVAMTAVAYVPAVRGGFVWDDDQYVTGNKTLQSARGLVSIWFEPGTTVQYYPLSFTTFWLERQAWGLNPAGYHLTNILLQGINAVLLWLVLRQLAVPGAWLAAALFAVHPVNVESVAWITERKNVLCGVFYLSAALTYLRFAGLDRASFCAAGRQAERKTGPAGRRRWYVAVLVLFACSLLSKSIACTLPAALLLVLWWKRDRLGWRDVRPVIPLLVMGLAMAMITAWVEKTHVGAVGREWGLSWVARCLVAGRVVWFYLGKLVWPNPIIFIYPRWHVDAAVWWQYLYPTGLFAALVALWLARRRMGKGPLVAVLYFIGTLSPAMGFADVYYMQYSFVADHFQYLASIGIIALGVASGIQLVGRLGTPGRRAGPVLAAGIVLLLGTLTWFQSHAYADLETLWRSTLRKNPFAWVAHNNLASILMDQGKIDEAVVHCNEALRLDSANARAHYNLANGLVRQGQSDKAIEHYTEALRLNPVFPEAHDNLGAVLLVQGKLDEAIEHYAEALRLKPDFPEAHNNLGNALLKQGKLDEAIEHYTEALRLKPDFSEAHNNLGTALLDQGKFDEAIGHYTEALRLKPGDLNALQSRALARYYLKEYDKAWADVRMFRKLGGTPDPDLVRKLTEATGLTE